MSPARYLIVEFVNEKEGDSTPSELVSSAWCDDQWTECCWPNEKFTRDQHKYLKAVKEGIQPLKDWQAGQPIRVIYSTDDFDKAVKKLNKISRDTDLESSDADQPKATKRRRGVRLDYKEMLTANSSSNYMTKQREMPKAPSPVEPMSEVTTPRERVIVILSSAAIYQQPGNLPSNQHPPITVEYQHLASVT